MYRGQRFPVVLEQVCTHCSRDFGPLLHTGLLQIFQVLGRFSSLHRFSIGFRSGDWLGHSGTLKCFLRSHSLVALAVCLGSLSCWKTQPRPIFNALIEGRRLLAKILLYMAPTILPLIRCSRPVPFAEKHPQSMMFPPPCFTVGMVFLGLFSSFFFLQTWWVELDQKFYFGLIWPHDLLSCLLWIIQMVFGKLQTGLDMCWLEQEDLNPWRCSVLLM